jgi:hypothetical protein
MEACEAGTSSMVAVARSAMKRCVAAGIALSSVPTRYQERIDFHAGGPDGALSAAALHGRWVAVMTRAASGSTSPAKTAGNAS